MHKVLIVDDSALIRHKLRDIVAADPDWRCCGEADSGETAIVAAADSKPHAILMDVSMPGMGGVKASEIIHAAHPSIKILILTLHESSELMQAALSAGAMGYIVKSDADEHLIAALNTVRSKRKYVSPNPDM